MDLVVEIQLIKKFKSLSFLINYTQRKGFIATVRAVRIRFIVIIPARAGIHVLSVMATAINSKLFLKLTIINKLSILIFIEMRKLDFSFLILKVNKLWSGETISRRT